MHAVASGVTRRVTHRVTHLGADLLDVVAPRDCLACQAPGRTLCDRCTAVLVGSQPVVDHDRLDHPVAIGGWLDGVVGVAMRGYKSGAGRGLADPLSILLAEAIAQLQPPPRHIVAIPPSLRARWDRGDDVLGRVVDRALTRLSRSGVRIDRVPLLQPARPVRDQRSLDSQGRRLNVIGSLRVRRGRTPTDARIVIVDDVLTTGATVNEAIRALTQAGMGSAIVGAAVIAATQPRQGPW
jgi:predicted amidophosphoribosyltransferase